MQGNESFNNPVNINQMNQGNEVESSLITLERSQKLDLLIHLISNLKQSLVLCGPKGIGKTVLLDEFRARKHDLWPIISIEATTEVSFESYLNQLSEFLDQTNDEYKNQDLLSILSLLDKQNQKIVIIIDEAGQLVPGLINSIIQHAADISSLRVVFSLTHDELHIKNSSDRSVDDCHFIDIPPLTKKQCGIFLQNLSAKPDAVVSFDAISDRMIDKLYLNTHGIPGRIISELPKLSNYQVVTGYSWSGIIFISAVAAIVIGYVIFDVSETDQETIETPLVLNKSETFKIASPVVQTVKKKEEIDTIKLNSYQEENKTTGVLKNFKKVESTFPSNSGETMSLVKDMPVDGFVVDNVTKIVPIPIGTEKSEVKQDFVKIIQPDLGQPPQFQKNSELKRLNQKTGLIDSLNVKQNDKSPSAVQVLPVQEKIKTLPAINQPAVMLEKKIKEQNRNTKPKEKTVDIALSDYNKWLLSQPKTNHTIQLMVLSKRQSAVDFLRKSKSLQKNLKFLELTKNNQKKFVIIYGSYKNSQTAVRKMKTLPVKYRKSWVRRINKLQADIKK